MEIPCTGGTAGGGGGGPGGGTWWLPSPIKVYANSSWTITAQDTNIGTGDAVCILHLSYAPVYNQAGKNGTIIRHVTETPSGTDDWVALTNTISDLDPTKNYIITGATAYGGGDETCAVRLISDSFDGMTPVYPATKKQDPSGINQLLNIPEGMPIQGTQTIKIEVFQAAAEEVHVFVFLAEE